jgi:phosphopantothenate synthetase
MDSRKAHRIWIEQCEAAHAIKSRFGVTDAFDYLVGEKLLNFANAAADRPDFARELPWFVSEVRCLFTADEIAIHLARLERAQNEEAADVLEEEDEDVFRESPAAAAERVRQFRLVKELLMATTLGTS